MGFEYFNTEKGVDFRYILVFSFVGGGVAANILASREVKKQ